MTTGELAGLVAAHQPVWAATPDEVEDVLADLRRRRPLVDGSACHALLAEMGEVATGRAFVIQGGDCAEPFADARPDRIRAKAAQLEDLADLFETRTALPVVRIGRFAGQYAKPRSSPVETLPDGSVLPAFHGEAVNGAEATEQARRADVRRLLAAYDHGAAGLHALAPNRFPPVTADPPARFARTYTSHEALLLDFERALVRPDRHGGAYASSAHFLWIGDRTRRPRGAHVHFAEAIDNPVGVKVGPTTNPDDLVDIVERLATGRGPGRLSLIVRMGAAGVERTLPGLLAGLGPLAGRVVWMCDPMHGNTRRTTAGQKTRVVPDVLDEVTAFVEVLHRHGVRPGGLHLEMTPDAVAECVDDHTGLQDVLAPYESTCDPRLNRRQAQQVVRHAADLLGAFR